MTTETKDELASRVADLEAALSDIRDQISEVLDDGEEDGEGDD